MAQRLFTVTALWDAEAQVFYAQSDIIGLHIEAPTLDEFEAVMLELAPGLVMANHFTRQELQSTAAEDLIPTIVWQRPATQAA